LFQLSPRVKRMIDSVVPLVVLLPNMASNGSTVLALRLRGCALAFHELTDHVPPRVWMAIGQTDWQPRIQTQAMRFARFPATQLALGVCSHVIDGVKVPVFGIAKTIADLFRYRRITGVNLAVEGLREALRQRKAKPAEIAKAAVAAGVWKVMEPYMVALTSNG